MLPDSSTVRQVTCCSCLWPVPRLAPTATPSFYLLTLSSQRYSIAWLEVVNRIVSADLPLLIDGRTDSNNLSIMIRGILIHVHAGTLIKVCYYSNEAYFISDEQSLHKHCQLLPSRLTRVKRSYSNIYTLSRL